MKKYAIYTDEKTKQFLLSATPKVILIGGCLGASNFGDILQLKNMIDYHKSVTSLVPIVIFDISNLNEDVTNNAMKLKYEVEHIIYCQGTLISNISDYSLELVNQVNEINNLHLYGGGFLNKHWGAMYTELIEFLLETFRVKSYIISGQQIDCDYSEQFALHCKKYSPSLVGVRDNESLKNMQFHGVKAIFSFDDAFEALLKIKSKTTVNRSTSNYLLHLNTSSYTGNLLTIQKLLKNINIIKACYPEFTPLIANAYNDMRIFVSDSLSTIVKLEDDFPYTQYEIIDFTKVAFNYKDDELMLKMSVNFGVSSSYHITLLLQMLGIPCWLNSNNEFYDQKSIALGINTSLEKFLVSLPYSNDKDFNEVRLKWLRNLDSFFNKNENTYDIKLDVDLPQIVKKEKVFLAYSAEEFEEQKYWRNQYWEETQRLGNDLTWQKEQAEKYWQEMQKLNNDLTHMNKWSEKIKAELLEIQKLTVFKIFKKFFRK
ncbi:MAG: polysaccharide pyruvyl transferase family protein [Burkholderiales bacterium]|nr:polysaccharide pyruvyl transferase family protein [Burkholderiales bacterium]